MEQFEVIKCITLTLGRMIEDHLREAGRKVSVHYEYTPDLNTKKKPAVTVIHYGLEKMRSGQREHEWAAGGEQFRDPSLCLKSRFLVSAWGKAPDNLDLLALVMRTFHDQVELKLTDEEEITFASGLPDVTLQPLEFAEHREICQLLDVPLAPSVSYWVGGYRLQSVKTTPIKRVRERVIDYRKIDG